MFEDYPDVLCVADVQKLLGISRHQVYHSIAAGRVRGIRIGKAYKIPKISLIDYLIGEESEISAKNI
jgi:excisionase family DNA binding protein